MLKHDLVSEYSRLSEVGRMMHWGAVLDQQTGPTNAFTVPVGQTFLMTHVHVQADTLLAGIADAFQASPAPTVYGVNLNDAAGSGQSVISFLAFRRWQGLFEVQNSPNWRNAPPSNVIEWKLKYPIPVPSGWTVQSVTGGEWGNQVAVYGYLVSEDGARTAGYKVSTSTTDANRRHGVASAITTASSATMIGGRTGQCIRILDMCVRIQPETNTTNKVRLHQVDGRTIFAFTNNNPSDLLERKFSPDGVFLKSGQGLQLIGTIAGGASVTVSYEYVDEADVPADVFWGYVEPSLPTPSGPTVGTSDFVAAISTSVTLYYPGMDRASRTNIEKTAPGVGYQHVVRGWAVSAQKDTTTAPDQTLLAISTGATGGQVEVGVLGTAQSNVQLSPVYTFGGHDQCLLAVMDDLALACPKDTGSIWIDTIAANAGTGLLSVAGTPDSTDADIDEWGVTVWGRTLPTRFTDPTNRGT
jgi:hypothetical protein